MNTPAGKDMRYGDYLALDAVLSAQHPRSSDPNELLFIVQHQTSELWMKLALHELKAARGAIAATDLPPAFKMLARVSRIFDWYRKDFEQGHQGYASLKDVFARHADRLADREDARARIRAGDYRLDFLPYDWALNDAR